ncbi:hypothetical protein BJF85_15930 [Saccharomonospora sp. CUA-673]|uniref:hypothetical protein n=1 Tax=Saccharomonospora sp. CUA-673 TaxID=1904969 RepID=UPI0009663D78|nr:hypothetical protein [Saccharomonospora sp. CUA-673]OLT46709.1 hypothetical protein BJF85_15930 [Saccharomonospora sp. CUA-673]
MSTGTTFAALRWRIMRHGPHDERGFGLVAGLVAAAGVITVAGLANAGVLHPSWLVVAVSLVGALWLLGPILLPGSPPVLDPMWFRTLPSPPRRIARDMAVSEPIGAGTVVTLVALISLVVVAAPAGAVAVAVAVVAALAQLHFLLWLGRCAAAGVTRLLRSPVEMWLAAAQMSVLLAVSFAGWVPVAAFVLPDLGAGGTEVVVPSTGAVPAGAEAVLLALPTGWGMAAVHAAVSSGSVLAVAAPVAGLVVGGFVLRELWVTLTAYALRTPPARMRSNITAGRRARGDVAGRGGPVGAVVDREVATWFRDPHRMLGLGHAWMTPVLMVGLVVPTSWSWAAPFVGVMAAVLCAMVAVNTYSLDGTALWQLLTVPGAIRADVHGRQLAWLVLFGLPVVLGTIALWLLTASPLGAVAFGMTLAATGAAAGAAPLFSALMPTPGADARDRVSTADAAGNPAGGQWTILTAVIAVALVPAVGLGAAGVTGWAAHLVAGAAVGAAALLVLPRITRRYLERSGQALLAALAAGDLTRLRTARATAS